MRQKVSACNIEYSWLIYTFNQIDNLLMICFLTEKNRMKILIKVKRLSGYK